MGVVLIFMSAVLNVVQSVLTKFSSIGGRVVRAAPFNLLKSFGSFFLFALISAWGFKWHLPTFVYASLYGAFLLCSNVFGYLALTKGPMSLTSIIVTYNVVIPCIYGVAFLGEKIRIVQGIGFVLLVISLMLLRKKDKEVKFKKYWLLCVLLTFFGNGSYSVILKMHQTAYPGQFREEFICIAMLVGFLAMLFVAILTKQKPNIAETKFGVPVGMLTAMANYIALYLSATVDATVLFPMTTVFSVCLTCIMSKIIFKDRFTLPQLFGIALGVISVILIK